MFKRKIAIINEETGEIKAYDTVKQAIGNINRYIVGVDGKYGLIDEKGNELCDIKYDKEISNHHYLARFIVILNGKYGFINLDGIEICKPKYDKVYFYSNGFATVKLNNKYGFIDLEGNEICDIEYENTEHFHNMRAPVKKNGKWGIIDSQGNILCDFKYDEIKYFTGDLWIVRNDDKRYSLLNEKFEEITPFKYTFIETPFDNSDIIKVCIGFKNGFITRSGKEIIPIIYDYSYDLGCDYPIIAEKENKWGIISRDGKVLVDFKYEHISPFDDNGYAELTQYRETRTMKGTFRSIKWADVNGKIYDIRPTKK